jgi:hypothetical protein
VNRRSAFRVGWGAWGWGAGAGGGGVRIGSVISRSPHGLRILEQMFRASLTSSTRALQAGSGLHSGRALYTSVQLVALICRLFTPISSADSWMALMVRWYSLIDVHSVVEPYQ